MMEHRLESEEFELTVAPRIFEEEIGNPCNTLIDIQVQSAGFSARTTMEIDVKKLAKFAVDLCRIYKKLSGEARLEEPYGRHMYVSFSGDGRGHIAVQGRLQKGNQAGKQQTLEFENDVDQTCFKISVMVYLCLTVNIYHNVC